MGRPRPRRRQGSARPSASRRGSPLPRPARPVDRHDRLHRPTRWTASSPLERPEAPLSAMLFRSLAWPDHLGLWSSNVVQELAGRRPRRGRAGGRRQARRARARPARLPRRRARPARGLPGPREDARRPLVRAGRSSMELLAHPVHARPHAVGRHRLVDLQPARRRLRVPAGPDLHQPPARRRDQPRPAEDAGGAARGDAGAAGHDRGHDAPARAAVPRARDAEPDRVRGHVPAPRGAARPLPAAHGVRLPEPRGRGRRARAAASSARGRRRAARRRRPRDAARDAGRVEQVHVAESVRALLRRPRRRDARAQSVAVGASPRGSLALLKLARCRAALRGPRLRRPGRRQGGRRARRSPTGSCSARSCGCSASRPRTSSARCSRRCRRRRRGRLGAAADS